jgi:hypothetical protein
MPISITCPQCGRQFSQLKTELAGKKVRCSCGTAFRLPTSPIKKPRTDSQTPAPSKATIDRSNPATIVDPFDIHYSDLEDILASPNAADPDFDPRQRSDHATHERKQELKRAPAAPENSPGQSPSSTPSVNKKRSSTEVGELGSNYNNEAERSGPIAPQSHVAVFVTLAMISAMVAFSFGIFVLSAKLTKTQFIWSERAHESIRLANSGQFGLQETTPGLNLGFQLVGWCIFAMAGLLILAAACQMLSAGIQLFANLPVLRWVDGLMATAAFMVVLLLIGTMFLQSTHTQHLNRQINQVAVSTRQDSEEPGSDEPANLQALRAQNREQSVRFQRGIAEISIAPGIVLACSLLRLFRPTRRPQ